VIAHARNLGYIKCEDNLLQPLHVVRPMRKSDSDNGSQGELMSAMTRISRGGTSPSQNSFWDAVVFSSDPRQRLRGKVTH